MLIMFISFETPGWQVADKAIKDWLNMIEHDYDPRHTCVAVASNDTDFAVDLRRLFDGG